MASRRTNREVEIKLKPASAHVARRILRQAGFGVERKRIFEDNILFDMDDLTLRQTGRLLRIRRAGRETLLTYKGQAAPGKHKSREELEIHVSDALLTSTIIERLGFAPVFRYQKYRTEYAHPGERGVVTLDETPIGCFLEVEGSPGWIDRTARRLGFQESDYITRSYGGLYLEHRRQHPESPADMIFAKRTT